MPIPPPVTAPAPPHPRRALPPSQGTPPHAFPRQAHAWIRPLLTKLVGPGGRWSGEYLSEKASTPD